MKHIAITKKNYYYYYYYYSRTSIIWGNGEEGSHGKMKNIVNRDFLLNKL
jgi:hypothetical protein